MFTGDRRGYRIGPGARLHLAALQYADLREADLREADLTIAHLERANLTGARLAGANLMDTNLVNANLTDSDLARANLADARLDGARLAGANLTEANLVNANLTDSDLAGANLADANLTGADFTRADLTHADLSRVIFADTVLEEANLTGTILTGYEVVRGKLTQTMPERRPRPESRLIRSASDAEVVACEWTRYFGFVDAIVTAPGADGGLDIESSGCVAQVKFQATPTGSSLVQQLHGVASRDGKRTVFFSLDKYTAQAVAWAETVDMALFRFKDHLGEIEPINDAAVKMLAE